MKILLLTGKCSITPPEKLITGMCPIRYGSQKVIHGPNILEFWPICFNENTKEFLTSQLLCVIFEEKSAISRVGYLGVITYFQGRIQVLIA